MAILLRWEVVVEVPETADVELLRERAKLLVPTEFYGIKDVVGRVWVEDPEFCEEGEDCYGTPS